MHRQKLINHFKPKTQNHQNPQTIQVQNFLEKITDKCMNACNLNEKKG